MSPEGLVCPIVSLVHHHGVKAVALLLHGHLLVHALDPRLTITQVGLKAPNLLLDHPACLTRQKNITSRSCSNTSFGTGTAWLRFLKFFNLYYFASVFHYFFFSFSFKFFFYSKRCVHQHQSTKPPESTDQFPLRRYFCEHLTSPFNKRQRKRDKMTAMRREKLYFN